MATPTAEEILQQSLDALGAVKTGKHADKQVTFKSPSELADAMNLAEQLRQGGAQKRIIARPGKVEM